MASLTLWEDYGPGLEPISANLRLRQPGLIRSPRLALGRTVGTPRYAGRVAHAFPGRTELRASKSHRYLSAASWTLEQDFFDSDGVPLSDHPSISVAVDWEKL